MKGWLYVLKNPALDAMYKIGFTNRDPMERTAELSNTSVPYEFEILYMALVEDAEKVEQTLHALLDAYRVNSNREFFNASLDLILNELQSALNSLGLKILYEEKIISNEYKGSSNSIAINDILKYKQKIIDAYQQKIDKGFDSSNPYYVEFLKKNQSVFMSKLNEILSDNVMINFLHSINSHIQISDDESNEWVINYMEGVIYPQVSLLLHEYSVDIH
jgi:hypothetical protein